MLTSLSTNARTSSPTQIPLGRRPADPGDGVDLDERLARRAAAPCHSRRITAMPRPSPRLALLAAALVGLACTRGGGSDDAQEKLSEAKVELRTAIDELGEARRALADARADLDRARAELDRARTDLERVADRAAATPTGDAPLVDLPPADLTLDPAIVAALQCPQEARCSIQRAALERLLADPALLVRQARVIPAMKEGEARGFKIFGIRSNSLPKLLGFKNGDLIGAVNGHELRTIDQALALYEELRKMKTIDVTGERRGQPFTVTLTITE